MNRRFRVDSVPAFSLPSELKHYFDGKLKLVQKLWWNYVMVSEEMELVSMWFGSCNGFY